MIDLTTTQMIGAGLLAAVAASYAWPKIKSAIGKARSVVTPIIDDDDEPSITACRQHIDSAIAIASEIPHPALVNALNEAGKASYPTGDVKPDA